MSEPAPPMLGNEDNFVLALAPPPPPLYCPSHGHGPCPTRDGMAPPLPSPTPPGLDINANPTDCGNSEADRDEDEGLDDVHPEVRRLLRKFAAAMAAHRAGLAADGWKPASLGLSSSNEWGASSL